jgi:hypothetical protein
MASKVSGTFPPVFPISTERAGSQFNPPLYSLLLAQHPLNGGSINPHWIEELIHKSIEDRYSDEWVDGEEKTVQTQSKNKIETKTELPRNSTSSRGLWMRLWVTGVRAAVRAVQLEKGL